MPTRSIYLDDEIDRLAKEITETSGVKLSSLFREFLLRWKALRGRIGELVVIQDTSALSTSIEEDPYRLDKWIDSNNTKKVLLKLALSNMTLSLLICLSLGICSRGTL